MASAGFDSSQSQRALQPLRHTDNKTCKRDGFFNPLLDTSDTSTIHVWKGQNGHSLSAYFLSWCSDSVVPQDKGLSRFSVQGLNPAVKDCLEVEIRKINSTWHEDFHQIDPYFIFHGRISPYSHLTSWSSHDEGSRVRWFHLRPPPPNALGQG